MAGSKPKPDHGRLEPQSSNAQSVSHQPAPAVVASASHVTTHVLPRRFIGGMPEAVAHSDDAQAKQEKARTARQEAIRRLAGGVQDAGRRGSRMIGDRRRSLVASIRVRRRGLGGEEYEEDVDLKQSSDEEDEGESSSSGRSGLKRKKKKKRKDVWVGESFDIGREFRSSSDKNSQSPVRRTNPATATDNNADAGSSNHIAQEPPRTRPGVSSRQTTQESFVTARTHVSSGLQSSSSLHLPEPDEPEPPSGYTLGLDDAPRPSGSFISEPAQLHRTGNSGASSLAPLISARTPESARSRGKKKATYADSTTSNIRARLKSAIRRPSHIDPLDQSGGIHGAVEPVSGTVRGKSKTVQFPVELEHHIQDPEESAPGNRAPADPGDVLAREGNETAGTSYAAAEEAMDDEGEDEDAILPGQVILRGKRVDRGSQRA